ELFSSGEGAGYVAEKAETTSGWMFPVGDELAELGYGDMFADMLHARREGGAAGATRGERDGKTLSKEEQMPDGRLKLIVKDEATGEFADVVTEGEPAPTPCAGPQPSSPAPRGASAPPERAHRRRRRLRGGHRLSHDDRTRGRRFLGERHRPRGRRGRGLRRARSPRRARLRAWTQWSGSGRRPRRHLYRGGVGCGARRQSPLGVPLLQACRSVAPGGGRGCDR